VTNKPEIMSSLGRVTEMWSEKAKDGLLRFLGRVYDKENKAEVRVGDDLWPLYVKELPGVNDPVILRWVKILEPYCAFNAKNNLQFVFPEHASSYLNGMEKRGNDYWLSRVDTGFNQF
jgi:hypothetical protein